VSQENHRHRRAAILAGGDGTRLKTLARAIAGDERPKQLCPVIGVNTLLEKTRRRAALVMNPVQTFTIVTSIHERFYRNHSTRRQRTTARLDKAGAIGSRPYWFY
jgi:mannose-1-phosphate guanylyltransferase